MSVRVVDKKTGKTVETQAQMKKRLGKRKR